MASFVPGSPETYEDQRRYTRARLVEVSCLDCPATVLVKKNSEHHTSIQWTSEALSQCQEFRREERRPAGRKVRSECSRLRASIEAAVRDGSIPIGAEDGW